jgi:glycosyltransferase involved in cell wall biosynthesis
MSTARGDGSLVSIVVVNYNYGRFLDQAVRSALAQTHPRTEVIVVDDGSTDDSRARIAAHGDDVVAVLKDNGGQASAFNAGFQASRGDLVLFLDADDVLLPGAAATAAAALAGHGAVKVHWQLWKMDEHGVPSRRRHPDRRPEKGELRAHVLRHGPNSYVSPPTSGNAWTRRFLEQVLPVPECGDKHGADAYLSMLAPLFGRIETVAEPQSCYRVHGHNFSGTSILDRLEHDLRRYEGHCRILGERVRALGASVDEREWRGPRSVYAWMAGVRAGTAEVESIVPEGATFILVDDAQWGHGDALAGRRCLPFTEKGGRYWGPPADDEEAVRELERLRREGAAFVVFAWPCFWWLDFYRGLSRHLRSHFECVMTGERMVVFDLRSAAADRAVVRCQKGGSR